MHESQAQGHSNPGTSSSASGGGSPQEMSLALVRGPSLTCMRGKPWVVLPPRHRLPRQAGGPPTRNEPRISRGPSLTSMGGRVPLSSLRALLSLLFPLPDSPLAASLPTGALVEERRAARAPLLKGRHSRRRHVPQARGHYGKLRARRRRPHPRGNTPVSSQGPLMR